MKKVVLIFLISFFPLQVCAKVITGEIRYDVNSARNEVMNVSQTDFDKQNIKNYIVDLNGKKNISNILKGQTVLIDRTLAYFSDGSYGVVYKNNPKNVYYYNSSGILTHNEIRDSLEYPYKSLKYDTAGNIVNRTLRVSEYETFIFNNSGELIAHWYGENCYDENNNIIMSRKITN